MKPRNAALRVFALMGINLLRPGHQAQLLREFRPEFKLPS